MQRSTVLLSLCLILGNGCDRGGAGSTDDTSTAAQFANSASVFSDSVADFYVHVFYEDGAAPYTGKIGLTTKEIWDVTKTSFQGLFQNHVGRLVFVPTVLGQMTALPDQRRTSWDAKSLQELAAPRVYPILSGSEAHVNVFFVNGTYNGDDSVLGIQFAGDNFAFVFKDVVIATGGDAVSQRYIEQATVVHELGHVVGLVNHGVPMFTPHEDSAHPHHSTDSNDIMYWAIESRKHALLALLGAINGNRMQLFGANSLADAKNFHP